MYQILFYGGFSFSFIAFICSTILFAKFRIPYIIGLLSGMTAKNEARKIGKKRKSYLFVKESNLTNKQYFHMIQEITFMDSDRIIE